MVHLSSKSESAIAAPLRLALADGHGPVHSRDAAISCTEVVDLIGGSYGGKSRMRGGDQAEPLVAPVRHAVR